MLFVGGVPGQISQQAAQRPELRVADGVQPVQEDGKHPLLLYNHHAQHGRPLTERSKGHVSLQRPHLALKLTIGMRRYPGISRGDVLQGSDGGLAAAGTVVAVLQDELVEPHHLRVPQPLGPFRLRQGGQVLVILLLAKREIKYKYRIWGQK